MQKKYFLLLFVFAFMMIVAACADDSNVEEETDGGEDGREETLGSGDLTVGMMNEIVTLIFIIQMMHHLHRLGVIFMND
jgi:hypothetical protein